MVRFKLQANMNLKEINVKVLQYLTVINEVLSYIPLQRECTQLFGNEGL